MLKHFSKKLLCSLLAAGMLVATLCAFVSPWSSQYIAAYRAFLTAESNGNIAVTVDVTGSGFMADLGTTTIMIYESSDDVAYSRVATYNYEDYDDMMGSGLFYYDTPITHDGTAGYYYFAKVYCYAGDGTNGHTRIYETASIRAIA